MDNTLVFLDEGFIYKLSKYLGNGKPIKFNRIDFAINLSKKEKLFCKKIFYYNAPPFQSDSPIAEEERRKRGYDKFIQSLQRHKEIVVREGRCQRLKIDGKFIYKQKAVDVLLAMDLSNIPINVPLIKNLEEQNIKTILYTYYEKKRDTNFSRSNELIKSVYKYVLLSKEDFDNAPLRKKETKYES